MADTVDTVKTQARNTKGRAWSVTINNPNEDWKPLFDKSIFSDTVAQLERGAQEGTLHVQGGVYFKNAVTFQRVKDLFPTAHIEPAKNWKALVNYCQKTDTAINGSRFRLGERPVARDAFVEFNLQYKTWQNDILDIIRSDPFGSRTVHWYWEGIGNVGKTTFCKHLCLKYDAVLLSGKASDMKCALAAMTTKPKIVIMDFPRSCEGYVSYPGIEEIKNGMFFSGKYESGMVIFDNPHVICFANFEPCLDMLSADRWQVKNIADAP